MRVILEGLTGTGKSSTLAAMDRLGLLPPIFAAAAQSLPDLGILANSSRLLRYRSGDKVSG